MICLTSRGGEGPVCEERLLWCGGVTLGERFFLVLLFLCVNVLFDPEPNHSSSGKGGMRFVKCVPRHSNGAISPLHPAFPPLPVSALHSPRKTALYWNLGSCPFVLPYVCAYPPCPLCATLPRGPSFFHLGRGCKKGGGVRIFFHSKKRAPVCGGRTRVAHPDDSDEEDMDKEQKLAEIHVCWTPPIFAASLLPGNPHTNCIFIL